MQALVVSLAIGLLWTTSVFAQGGTPNWEIRDYGIGIPQIETMTKDIHAIEREHVACLRTHVQRGQETCAPLGDIVKAKKVGRDISCHHYGIERGHYGCYE